MYPVSFPCGLLHDIHRKKVVSPYVASPYCLFPGCIVTWAWSLAKEQYMFEWLLTVAPEQRYWQNRETTNIELPSPSRTSATHHTSSSASSAKLKSRSSTRHQTRFKHHYKHTRTNRTHKTRLVFTAFPVNAVKYTSRDRAQHICKSQGTPSTQQTRTPR